VARRLRKRPAAPAEKPVRKARSLDDLEPAPKAEVARSRSTYLVRVAEIRRQAGHEFITDPQGRSVRWWWEREDRDYRHVVKLATFEEWARDDEWVRRRDQFWLEIEFKVLQDAQHKLLVQRLREVNELTLATDAMSEYLRPLMDTNGHVRRHPERLDNGNPNPLAGLPIFPLEMPPIDKFGKLWIDMHKLLMVKRGEAISRSEETKRTDGGSDALDPATSSLPFTRDDIRNLARFALEMRQPELRGDGSVLEMLEHEDAERAVDDKEALDDEEADDG
jgi:hypothetical protein